MKVNKVYLQLVQNIKTADAADKVTYQDMLKRTILKNIGDGVILGNIKEPEVMAQFLKEHAQFSPENINAIVTAMSGSSEEKPYADHDIILITGQTGIGKTYTAKKIHKLTKPGSPFITINAATLQSEFHGSELFGVEKGAYTGADADKDGAFVAAGDGTLFIDELQSLPVRVQGMLNVALDEKQVTKVGPSNIKVPYRCKLVFASNENLEDLVKGGQFRADLYSRLTGPEAHHIDMQNLNSDTDKIKEIINNEADKFGIDVSPEVVGYLQRIEYDYGIRELQSILRKAFERARETKSNIVKPEHLEGQKETLEKKATEVSRQFQGFDNETMRYIAQHYTGDVSEFPIERIQKDRISKVYEDLGGDATGMSNWLENRSNLGIITSSLENPKDLSTKSIEKALRKVMGKFSVIDDSIVNGMNRIPGMVESKEDDFEAFLPEEAETKELDHRVLEALDNSISVVDADVLGISERI